MAVLKFVAILLVVALGIGGVVLAAPPSPKGSSVDFVGALFSGDTTTLHAVDGDGINLETLTDGTATLNGLSGPVVGSTMTGTGVLTVSTFLNDAPFAFIIDLAGSPITVAVSGTATKIVFTLGDAGTSVFGLNINLGKSGKGKGKKK